MKSTTVIGVDVGGTKIRAARISGERKIEASIQIPTNARGNVPLMTRINEAIEGVWSESVSAIGVGLAGLTDHEKGVFLGGPNLPKSFARTPVAALLEKRFRMPVAIDNDVHCFTLAEARLGAGKGRKHVVGLAFGTGIGGGIVIDGRLYRGRNNAAGEFGHHTVSFDSDIRCSCGSVGHFESFASGTAMSRLYRSFGGKQKTALEVEELAFKGDKRAKKVLALMSKALAVGIANVVQTLNPEVVVVGGGLSAVKMLWKPVLAAYKKQLLYPVLRSTPITRTALGKDAAVIGAALLVRTK